MNIEEIRNAFSKGNIAITKNGIMVSYTFKERWVTESFFEKSRGVFIDLLETSDRLQITCILGKVMKFVFHNDLEGQEIILYPPISEEISLQELEILLENSRDEGKEEEFCEFFMGVDLSDEDEVLSKLKELFGKREETHKTNVMSLPTMTRWKKVSQLATRFASLLGFRYEVFEPDSGFDGSFTIYFPEGFRERIVIAGKLKSLFEEILGFASGVEIECNINEGFLNLTFYN